MGITNKTYTTELGTRSDVVVLGNKDRPDRYEAHVEFGAFDGEIPLKIAYPDVFNTDSSLISDKMTIVSGAESVNLYKVGDDGLEFEIVLASIPTKNVWEFSLAGHDELRFHYQGTLEDEWYDYVRYQPGFAKDLADYLDKTSRPDYIVGSYAVYHKTKKDYIVGRTDYGTGKLMHIHCPKAVDDLGREIKCSLNIAGNLMSVTVPRRWLDSAVYPVTIDPYFGYNTIGGTPHNWYGYNMYAYSMMDATVGASLTAIECYCYGDGDVDPLYAALYDSDGTPDNRLQASPGSTNLPDGVAAWVSVAMADVITLSASTLYWLGMTAQDGSWTIYHDNTGEHAARYDQSAPWLPDPASDSGSYYEESVRGLYTAGGGPTYTPQVMMII